MNQEGTCLPPPPQQRSSSFPRVSYCIFLGNHWYTAWSELNFTKLDNLLVHAHWIYMDMGVNVMQIIMANIEHFITYIIILHHMQMSNILILPSHLTSSNACLHQQVNMTYCWSHDIRPTRCFKNSALNHLIHT